MQPYLSASEAETIYFARNIATQLQPGDVVLLQGDLGAGKTTLAQALGQALGVMEHMTSPTFPLMNIYPIENGDGLNGVVHIDTYRINDEEELYAIGAEDYIGSPDTITLIEWPEKIPQLLAKMRQIVIAITQVSPEERVITVRGLTDDATTDTAQPQ